MDVRQRCHPASAALYLALAYQLCAPAIAQRPQYAIEELPASGDRINWIAAINLDNEAVGASWIDGRFDGRAYFWANGDAQSMGVLSQYTGPLYGYSGQVINGAGHVVGVISTPGEGTHQLFSWNRVDGMRDLGIGAPFSADAFGLTEDGQFVYSTLLSDWHFTESFRWINGESFPLPSLVGPHVHVRDQNEMHEAVGYCGGYDWRTSESFPYRATLWNPDREPIDLGTLGGASSRALAINDLGEVVGYSQTANGDQHLFLWRNSEMLDLGTFGLEEDFPSGFNNDSTMVGYGLFENRQRRAFIWRDGEFEDLNDLVGPPSDLTITWARDINDNGTIVGSAARDSGPNVAVVLHRADIWLDEPTPGRSNRVNSIEAHRASPGARVTLVYGFDRAPRSVPNCPGVRIQIADPRLAGQAIADQDGVARWSLFVPAGAAGKQIQLQVVQQDRCRTSQRIQYTFR